MSLTDAAHNIRIRVPHRRRAAMALVGAGAVATAMVVRGQVPDPLTAVLSVLAALGVFHLRGTRIGRPGPRLHDEIDPETGVGNARGALSLIEREATRAGSYGSLFSIAVVDISRTVFAEVPGRRSSRILAELLQGVAADVRTDDRVCRVTTSDRELLVVVLPDTGAGGARQFTDRLVAHTQQHLAARTLPVDGSLRAEIMTQPEDQGAIQRFTRRLEVLVGAETRIHHGVRVRSRQDAQGARGPGPTPSARSEHAMPPARTRE